MSVSLSGGLSVGTGSGLGAIPFAIRSTDSLPAIFTSTAARDTYYTVTAPGDLTGNLAAGREAVGVGTVDGDPTTVTSAFIRNDNNTSWIPIASNFVGQTGPTGPTGPAGPASNPLADENISANLTISPTTPNNIGTYRNKNVVNINSTPGNITVTLDTISSFLAATPGDEFVIQFVNDSGVGDLIIVPGSGDKFGQIIGNVSLSQGQAIKIKLPSAGNVWMLLSDTINASGSTTPQRPDEVPTGDVILIGTWDASTGTFPAGASKGNLYEVSVGGTVDSVLFNAGDFIIAVVDSPSTTVFANNWQNIDGSGNVHTWAGMQGVITDPEITTVLNRLGFNVDNNAIHDNVAGEINAIAEKFTPTGTDLLLIEDSEDSFNKKRIKISYLSSANTPLPSLHGLSIDIPSRVDLNTNLNTQHTISFDVSNFSQITLLQLIVTVGTNQTLVLPTIDGVQSQNVNLAGIDTSVAGSVTFQLSGTYAGGTITSDIVTVTIANLQPHEQSYYGVLADQASFTAVDVSTLTSVDVTNSGTVYDIVASAQNTEVLGILSPNNRDPVSILNTISNIEALSTFNTAPNLRVINGVTYNLVAASNNSGFTGTFNYRVTTE